MSIDSRPSMNLLFDSFWRAAAYCLHPRVILLSLAPLLLMAGLALVLGYFFYEPALDAVTATIDSWGLMKQVESWLRAIGMGMFVAAIPPLVVVFVSTPVIVVLSLLVVAGMMTPAIVNLVAARRFPTLERLRGGSMLGSAFGAMWATVLALAALVLSIPLWFVPPLVLIVPPLIWGWLAYRMMSYDVLADHASRDERRELIRRHRTQLFGMGVVTGYLGAAPSLVWVSGAMAVVLAPILVPLAIWIYMLVFAFSSLWFTHYSLVVLQAMRAQRSMPAEPAAEPMGGTRDCTLPAEPPALPPI
jgi:hypothetical protein